MPPTPEEKIRKVNVTVQSLCVEAFKENPGSLPHALGAMAVALQILKDAAIDFGITADEVARVTTGDAVVRLAAHLRANGVIRIDKVPR